MENLYGEILKKTKEIRSGLMNSLTEIFMFSMGKIPDEITQEMEVLGDIEGLAIGMMAKKGEPLKNFPGKEGYVFVEYDGEKYIAPKAKLFFKSSEKEKINCPQNTVPVCKEDSENAGDNLSYENSTEELPANEELVKNEVEENNMDEDTEMASLLTEHAAVSAASKEDKEVPGEIESETGDSKEEDTPTEEESEKQEENIPMKATVIGGDYKLEPVIAPMSRADVFVEEKRKAASDLVFDTYRLSVCHMGSRAEDMQVMIAPLKIQKYSCPTVPIIVSIYYKGRAYTVSSFDKNEDGRNIVTIEVNEYYFLCRGSFNDNGEFQSSIVTTGISANQGDMMNITSLKKHRPTGNSVRNGHLKFRYTGEDGPGIVEIFPIELNEKDFIMMTRCGEFVEYVPISNGSHGLSRAILYDAGIKSEVVCRWDGDFLEAEIVPI